MSAAVDTRGWLARNRMTVTPLLFLLPGVLFFAVYVIIPIVQSFHISTYEWNGLGRLSEQGEFVGIRNYQELLSDRAFEVSLRNNVKWLVLYLLAIPAGLFIALFLNQTVAGIRIYKSLFFFPFVLSQVVVGLVFSWFYLPREGLLNAIVTFFGLEPVNILGDPTLATYGIIAAGLWPQTAYCMILYLTGLNAVDPEQVEAGRLDRARGWRMLWYVILPQLRPRDVHCLCRYDYRGIEILRHDFGHDKWWSVRFHSRAQLLHVRKGTFRNTDFAWATAPPSQLFCFLSCWSSLPISFGQCIRTSAKRGARKEAQACSRPPSKDAPGRRRSRINPSCP